MKLLPKEPTQEMWEKAWNSIKVNEELDRVRKVLSIHEIRMLLNHFCGAMYAAAPEVKDEPQQEFWWLIETTDGRPLYATGEPTNLETWIGQWTRNPLEAMRFKTRKAAETVMLRCGLFKQEDNEGYPAGTVLPVEHCFIHHPSPRIAELEAEVARLRKAICGTSDAYQLLTNVANSIESPADVQMAVSALRRIDEALK